MTLKFVRCLIFGFVWAFFTSAMGVPLFSWMFFLLLFPAFVVFEGIEYIFFAAKKAKEEL